MLCPLHNSKKVSVAVCEPGQLWLGLLCLPCAKALLSCASCQLLEIAKRKLGQAKQNLSAGEGLSCEAELMGRFAVLCSGLTSK